MQNLEVCYFLNLGCDIFLLSSELIWIIESGLQVKGGVEGDICLSYLDSVLNCSSKCLLLYSNLLEEVFYALDEPACHEHEDEKKICLGVKTLL